MAKFVIAGKSDCPYYARVEILGDNLRQNLPSLDIHKIVKKPTEWESWIKEICTKNGWSHEKSPIIWRELIDRGGKGTLIGDANDFQEYANIYYGYKSQLNSDDVRKIAVENAKTKIELDEEDNYYRSLVKPIHICVTNATSGVAYNLINSLLDGEIFGKETEVSLHLLSSNEDASQMDAIKMEILDFSYPLIRDIIVTSDVYQAFCDSVAIVILDDIEFDENDDKPSIYEKNAAIFKRYALVANQVAKSDCKVLISGSGPVNFNTHIFSQNCTNLSKKNIVGVSRVIENNCRAILSQQLKVNSSCISDVIAWGNANSHEGRYVDLTKIRVHKFDGAIWGPPEYSIPLLEIIYDNKWLETFPDLLKTRRETIDAETKHGMSMSQASAVSTVMFDWWNGCEDKISSMILVSQGWYGVPEGLVFSFPVRLHSEGYWCVVEDINIDDTVKEHIQQCVKELQDELAMYQNPAEYRERIAKEKAELIKAASSTIEQQSAMTSSKEEILVSKPSSLEKIVEEHEALPSVTSEVSDKSTLDGKPDSTHENAIIETTGENAETEGNVAEEDVAEENVAEENVAEEVKTTEDAE